MGAARERRKAMEAAGVEVPLPPKNRKVTWTFELPPEGYDTFQKVHDWMRKKDMKVPESEESFAAGVLTIGLKTLVAKIAAEDLKNKVQVYVPGDMAEASRRLQQIKGEK